MTDKQVQKLNRRELLEFLLAAQTENETLRQERDELLSQVSRLEEESGISHIDTHSLQLTTI